MHGVWITPAIQLRAVDSKARGSALCCCTSHEANCDGFLDSRARQLQWLVLRPLRGLDLQLAEGKVSNNEAEDDGHDTCGQPANGIARHLLTRDGGGNHEGEKITAGARNAR